MPVTRLRRIYGRSRSAWVAQSLWEGADHLLVVRHGSFTENYQRLFFRDIESIVIQPSARRMGWNMALGLLTALALTLAVLVPGGIWPGGAVALLLGLAIAANALRGPTCRVEARTRVNSVRLYGFVRMRRSRREVARLAGLITAAQGAYDALAHGAALAAVAAAPVAPSAPSVARPRRVAAQPRLRQPDHGGWHRILVAVLAVEALAFLPFLITRYAGMLAVVATCLLLTFALTCVAVVRNVRLLVPLAWRRWTWVALGYQILRGMSMFITFTAFNFSHAITHPQSGAFFFVSAADLAGSQVVYALVACTAVMSLALAAWGALALWRGAAPAGALPPPLMPAPAPPPPAPLPPQEGSPADAAS
jgi:hypothetical protein